MSQLNFFFAVLSAIILFLYGLESLSKELQDSGGDKLKIWLSKITSNSWLGFLLGLVATLLIQSSTAVTSITVTFVDAGVIAFRDSLAVLIGAKIGTTATAWLVSFKMTQIGPIFIVLGTALGFLLKNKTIGKAIFYFGFIFFTLDVISYVLEPIKSNPKVMEYMAYASSPVWGILIGAVMTVIVQSSTVTTGLAVLFAQQGILTPEQAVPIVIGANWGTTTTALFISMKMSHAARLSAWANTLMTTVGVLIFLPFTRQFADWIVSFAATPAMAVAWAHLIFNLATALPLMLILNPFSRWMLRWGNKIQ